MTGYIYIMSGADGNAVKVGETRVSPQKRTKAYADEHHLQNFELLKTYAVPEAERKNIERAIHRELKNYRISLPTGAREIFACPEDTAVSIVEKTIAKNKEVIAQKKEENKKNEQKAQIEYHKKRKERKKYNNIYKDMQPLFIDLSNYDLEKIQFNFIEIIKIYESIEEKKLNIYLPKSHIFWIYLFFGISYVIRDGVKNGSIFNDIIEKAFEIRREEKFYIFVTDILDAHAISDAHAKFKFLNEGLAFFPNSLSLQSAKIKIEGLWEVETNKSLRKFGYWAWGIMLILAALMASVTSY
jgi:hypothetical protein